MRYPENSAKTHIFVDFFFFLFVLEIRLGCTPHFIHVFVQWIEKGWPVFMWGDAEYWLLASLARIDCGNETEKLGEMDACCRLSILSTPNYCVASKWLECEQIVSASHFCLARPMRNLPLYERDRHSQRRSQFFLITFVGILWPLPIPKVQWAVGQLAELLPCQSSVIKAYSHTLFFISSWCPRPTYGFLIETPHNGIRRRRIQNEENTSQKVGEKERKVERNDEPATTSSSIRRCHSTNVSACIRQSDCAWTLMMYYCVCRSRTKPSTGKKESACAAEIERKTKE